MLTGAADLPQRLANALKAGQRGSWQREPMSPQLTYGRHAGPAPYTARAAAVLLLLFQREGRWHLPLTERPETMVRHGGQISLPGGAVDAFESSSSAALREMREELGVNADVELLGRLADCYVFASDFLITPWLAVADFDPRWNPHAKEVQNVVELPIDVLFDSDAVGELIVERGPLVFHAPCIRMGEACIWGATSMILSDLAGVLRYLLEND